LPAFGTVAFPFTVPVLGLAPQGKYSIRAWAVNPGDLYPANDTSGIKEILILPSIALIPEGDA
jgi:hypothetical protein